MWEATTKFCEAFRLGKSETDAATNLMAHVPGEVVESLTRFVRTAPVIVEC